MKNEKKQFKMVFTGILCGLIFVMSLVPFLGYIPLGFMNATIIHIPVIVGALVLGPGRGAFLGLVFGLSSLWKNTVSPNLTSFVFSPFIPLPGKEESFADFPQRLLKCLFITVFSRVMIGITSYGMDRLLSGVSFIRPSLRRMICGAVGAMTNTILVMGGIYFLYGEAYATAKELSVSLLSKIIAGVVVTQGIPEALISAVLTSAIVGVLQKISDQQEKSC